MAGHQPKSEECDSCGWPTEELTEVDAYARTKGHGPFTPDDQKEWAWLCEVCRSSYAGNAYLYPRNYDDDIVLRTIAWQTNAILDAIAKLGDRLALPPHPREEGVGGPG